MLVEFKMKTTQYQYSSCHRLPQNYKRKLEVWLEVGYADKIKAHIKYDSVDL
jgi:hypothetical protein